MITNLGTTLYLKLGLWLAVETKETRKSPKADCYTEWHAFKNALYSWANTEIPRCDCHKKVQYRKHQAVSLCQNNVWVFCVYNGPHEQTERRTLNISMNQTCQFTLHAHNTLYQSWTTIIIATKQKQKKPRRFSVDSNLGPSGLKARAITITPRNFSEFITHSIKSVHSIYLISPLNIPLQHHNYYVQTSQVKKNIAIYTLQTLHLSMYFIIEYYWGFHISQLPKPAPTPSPKQCQKMINKEIDDTNKQSKGNPHKPGKFKVY